MNLNITLKKFAKAFINGASAGLYFDKEEFIKKHNQNQGSIEQDWKNVGNDLRKSMNFYAEKYKLPS